MEKVAYILGAGFSAPLGLPVMRDFLIKSKDLYFSAPEEYTHFLSVFDMIENLSIIKNYYESDLFNIEEILSFVEMSNFLMGKKLKNDFLKYISDVILYYTPHIKPYYGDLPGNWYDFIFGEDKLHSYYGYFVANLFNIEFYDEGIRDLRRLTSQIVIKNDDSPLVKYAVITLNYDMILEDFCDFFNNQYKHEVNYSFDREMVMNDWNHPPLAKLHGSVDLNLIVPPTWAKGSTPIVTPTWKNAFKILKECNHIRFIGYSLPISDAYIKYLIKSAVVQAKHLKSIDVICLDPNGSIKKRYDDFIKFAYFRFVNADTADYLKMLYDTNKYKYSMIEPNKPLKLNKLEKAHEAFILTY